MKRSPYFWCWKVLGVSLDIIFFGVMGYTSWSYIFRTPDTKWILLLVMWPVLCSCLITPAIKIYFFAKSLYSTPIKADR